MTLEDDVAEALITADVLTAAGTTLTERFWAAWQRRIERLRGDDDQLLAHLAAILRADSETLTLTGEAPMELVADERTVARWPSRAAARADVAVIPLLAAWYEPWRDYDDQTRLALVARLRAFLPACPACETALEPAGPATGISCPGCGAVLLEPVAEQDRF